MSSYLLLRNNQESGPHSLNELRDMGLRPYDLIWVVAKSAAWRYPSEIQELKSFAPPLPESAMPSRKHTSSNSEPASEGKEKFSSSVIRPRDSDASAGGSVYVNMPSGKKGQSDSGIPLLFEFDSNLSERADSQYDFSDLYQKKSSRIAQYSGKILWFSTILLLFGTGILTGLFISDRRKFFSSTAKAPRNLTQESKIPTGISKNNVAVFTATPVLRDPGKDEHPVSDSITLRPKRTAPVARVSSKKRVPTTSVPKKDSIQHVVTAVPVDPIPENKGEAKEYTEGLRQQIRIHPENYLQVAVGRYSTGMFGGISSFPITVTNHSAVDLDHVDVEIRYVQTNGKVFKTERLSYTDLKTGESVSLKAPKSARGVKVTTRLLVE